MTSYEFEKAAKNAVIQTLSENISIDQLDLVWFAHELGYKKCTIWGQPMGNRYAEVTYNRDKDEMYVDIYQKRGSCCVRNKIVIESDGVTATAQLRDTSMSENEWIIDTDIPIFKGEGREYVDRLVFIGEE